MGRMALDGMLEMSTNRRVTLSWHLQSNHYPPPPAFMVDVAEAAIDACNEGDYERLIELPNGAEHRRYGSKVPANVIVESLHLDAFLDEEDNG